MAGRGRPPLQLLANPSQRLLAQGVIALSGQIVRSLAEGRSVTGLHRLREERQRMLRELGESVTEETSIPSLAALTAAVIESELALDQMQHFG
jgi:hypothetical protein